MDIRRRNIAQNTQSAQSERQEADKRCDHIIDATQDVQTVIANVTAIVNRYMQLIFILLFPLYEHTSSFRKKTQCVFPIILGILAVVITINIAIFGRFFTSQIVLEIFPLISLCLGTSTASCTCAKREFLLQLLGDDAWTVSSNPLYSTLAQSNHIWLLAIWKWDSQSI
jgi:hypothetical protein